MTPDVLPLVTIAIPTRDRANSYLPLTLRSALSQTYAAIEIVVSDNGSSDHTEEFVASFSDPRVRYYKHEQNIGPADNAHFCLAQARGAYFLMLHDDDQIDRDFIDTCMSVARYQLDVGVIRTGTRVVDAHGKVLYESPNRVAGLPTEEFFLGWFSSKTSIYLCSTLFNTQRLRDIGGLRSRHHLFDDAMAIVQLAANYGRADVENVKASFRNHDVRISTTSSVSDWCEDSLELLDTIIGLASKDKEELRRQGLRFFARKSYRHASLIRQSWRRFRAHMIVYRSYSFHCLPPFSGLLVGEAFMRKIRGVEGRLRSAFSS